MNILDDVAREEMGLSRGTERLISADVSESGIAKLPEWLIMSVGRASSEEELLEGSCPEGVFETAFKPYVIDEENIPERFSKEEYITHLKHLNKQLEDKEQVRDELLRMLVVEGMDLPILSTEILRCKVYLKALTEWNKLYN